MCVYVCVCVRARARESVRIDKRKSSRNNTTPLDRCYKPFRGMFLCMSDPFAESLDPKSQRH
jgi:hypothetical protein